MESSYSCAYCYTREVKDKLAEEFTANPSVVNGLEAFFGVENLWGVGVPAIALVVILFVSELRLRRQLDRGERWWP